MITKEQFKAYLRVRDSGSTNMFDVKNVIELAEESTGVRLTKDDCIEIMKNFGNLEEKYQE